MKKIIKGLFARLLIIVLCFSISYLSWDITFHYNEWKNFIYSPNSFSIPNEIPEYPNMKGTFAIYACGKTGSVDNFVFTTNDNVDDVISFYSKNLLISKWKSISQNSDSTENGKTHYEFVCSSENVEIKVIIEDKGEYCSINIIQIIGMGLSKEVNR
jgi:hypothetical protein